jgi:hypothetical protein
MAEIDNDENYYDNWINNKRQELNNMTISKECDPYWWSKQPKYKTSLTYNLCKDILIFLYRLLAVVGVLTVIAFCAYCTNHDTALIQLDDQFPKGIPFIHEYILHNYGPK